VSVRVRRFALALLACVAGLTTGKSAPAVAQAPAAPPVLRVAHSGDADSLDPQTAVSSTALVILTDLFEGLYTLDRDGRAVLGAADSVRELKDAQGPVLEFTLRPGLRWSDGTPLTAGDFEFAFKRLADPATGGTLLASNVALIRNGEAALAGRSPPGSLGVRALDPRRLRLELVRNVAWLPSVLAFPSFAPLPRHAIEKHGRAWTRPGNHVGNGAFRLVEWTAGNKVRAERNPYFHDARSVRLDAVEYLPAADLNTGLQLFRTGAVDTVVNFPPQKLELIRTEMPGALRLAPSLGVTAYLFNFRRPVFRDLRVRRALALAVDRDVLTTRVLRTGDVPAYGVVPSGLPGYLAALGPPRSTQAARVAEARRLLAEAGHGPGNPLRFELLYHSSEEHRSVAVAAAAMWSAIGVQATLRNAERRVVEAATRSGEFDMVRTALFSAYPDPHGWLGSFTTGNAQNGGGYANPAFDAAVEAAERELEPGPRRAAAQRRAEQRLVDDQALLPLYFMTSKRLVSPRVSGWSDRSLSALRPARYLAVDPRPSRPCGPGRNCL
jgi:oligopeptide transport system substrate-binding protein